MPRGSQVLSLVGRHMIVTLEIVSKEGRVVGKHLELMTQWESQPHVLHDSNHSLEVMKVLQAWGRRCCPDTKVSLELSLVQRLLVGGAFPEECVEDIGDKLILGVRAVALIRLPVLIDDLLLDHRPIIKSNKLSQTWIGTGCAPKLYNVAGLDFNTRAIFY